MSIWIRSICTTSVAALRPPSVLATMRGRLPALTDLYCPDDEDDLELMSKRLVIDPLSDGATFGVWALRYRLDEPDRFLRIERWSGAKASEEAQEISDELAISGRAAARVQDVLARTVDIVGISLTVSDANSMGWPVAIAAAASIAAAGDGLVCADDEGWLDPKLGEARLIE